MIACVRHAVLLALNSRLLSRYQVLDKLFILSFLLCVYGESSTWRALGPEVCHFFSWHSGFRHVLLCFDPWGVSPLSGLSARGVLCALKCVTSSDILQIPTRDASEP